MSAAGTRVVSGLEARLLDRVTATGASAATRLAEPLGTFTVQTVLSGGTAVTAISITLQGSLDGTNWTTLATSTSLTGDQQYAVDKPQNYIRANWASVTATANPTLTVYVAGLP